MEIKENWIAEQAVNANALKNCLLYTSGAGQWDILPDDVFFAIGNSLPRFFQRHVVARIVVFEGDAFGFGFFLLMVNIVFTTEAVMRAAQFNQLFRIFFINAGSHAFRLDIRAIIAADVRSFVMVQATFL